MEEYLTCAVCLELFNSQERLPLILTCGHSLCKACILSIRQAQGFIICPIDRATENKTVESLITNLALLQLVDVSNFTDYPRCRLHPSKKLRYYCSDPCGQAFCSKCILEHSYHKCLDPEDAKSLEALLRYIESECFKMTAESEHNEGLAAAYNIQILDLSERTQRLEREIRESFNKARSSLVEREKAAMAEVEHKAQEIQSMIEARQKVANEQVALTSCVLKEVVTIQDSLKSCRPQERLKHVVKLHKLLGSRSVSFIVAEDYLKRLPSKLKSPTLRLLRGTLPKSLALKKLMVIEEADVPSLVGVKRARLDGL